METPGLLTLANFSIGAAGTQIGEWIDCTGALALSLQGALRLGTAGIKVQLYFQTTLDGGTTPIDIACITWTAAGSTKVYSLSGLTPRTTEYAPTDATLADDTCIDGIIGDQVRAKVVSTGIYSGSTLLTATAVGK